MEANYERWGEPSQLSALAHLVAAVLRTAAQPLVYVLDPPRTMAEGLYPQAQCTRMHTCRYHPKLPCWMVGECVNCFKGERVSQGGGWVNEKEKPWAPVHGLCVRVDLLKRVRARVTGDLPELLQGDGRRGGKAVSKRHAKAPRPARPLEASRAEGGEAARCGHGALLPAHPQLSRLIFADWRWFHGPIHLNTLGSAMVACAVHLGLFLRCADACGATLAQHMQRRRDAFCAPLDTMRLGEPPPLKELNQLELALHAEI